MHFSKFTRHFLGGIIEFTDLIKLVPELNRACSTKIQLAGMHPPALMIHKNQYSESCENIL